MNCDYTATDIRKMYDDWCTLRGARGVQRYMERARRERPRTINSIVHKRLALGCLQVDDPALFRALQGGRKLRRPEPARSSPLEQIKGRTSLLNEYGEMTGGNYRSSL
jgi:hypothetical protein